MLSKYDRLLTKRFVERKKRKDKEKDVERTVMTATKVIMAKIKQKKYDTSTYPNTTDIHNTTGDWIPKLLKTLLQVLVRSDLRQNSIGQAIVQAAKPRSTIMPMSFGLAVELDHVFGSRFCNSYIGVTRFKQSVMVMEDATHTGVVLPSEIFSQNIADNVDQNLCTLDGKNTFHGMGIIQVSTNNNGLLHEEKAIKRIDLQRVASVS